MKKLSILLLIFVVFSCSKESTKTPSNINDFNAYIATYTRGVIPTKSKITVVLNKPQEDWTIGKELTEDLLTISPKIKGVLIAKNNRTLSFIPEERLKNNTEYSITFHLSKLVKVNNDKLKDFNFKVKTIQQDFSVFINTLQSYSKDWLYINGRIQTNDEMSFEDAESLVKAIQQGKDLKLKWDEGIANGTEFQFTIDSIQRFEEDYMVDIEWDGSKLGIDTKGKIQKIIIGKTSFQILSVEVVESPTQYVQINFTDPLKKNQNFKGLVKFSDYNGRIKYTVDGNVLKVYPKRKIEGQKQLTVYEGLKSTDGYKTTKVKTYPIIFEQLKPAVRFIGKGAILPNSSNLKLNFEAVNLKAVDIAIIRIYENNVLQFLQNNELASGNRNLRQVGRPIARKTVKLQKDNITDYAKWNAFAIDLSKLIQADPGAIYRVELKFKKQYSLYDCGGENLDEDDQETIEINYDEEETDSSYWDSEYGYYDDYNYYYDWRNRDNPCSRAYYKKSRFPAKNIIASDLGVIAKVADDNMVTLAVSNLLTTDAVSGAKIDLLNYQQQKLATITTNGQGFASARLDYKPYFAVISQGKHKTYVKLNDGTSLSLSKFDVTGAKSQKGLKGYIYGERGVWRPGDNIFLTFVLDDNANELPKGHPVKLELTDPQGRMVDRIVKTNGVNGFYNFNLATDEDAPTGNWTVKIKVGGASFTKTLKIETIKPNRLKIKLDFDNELLTDGISGNISALWLHGAIAKNLQTDIKMRLIPIKTKFKGYPSYVFDDPARNFYSEEYNVFDAKLNSEGKASFDYDPDLGKSAPGMLRASFVSKVYEKGGDFSTSVASKQYSPYDTYIGLLRPKGDKARNMLLTDQKHTFNVITVDSDGKPKPNRKLEVRVYHLTHSWWWDASDNNLSSYTSRSGHTAVFQTTIKTGNNGKGTFKFEIKEPQWGRYLVRVYDPNGGHATGETVFIDWPGWAGRARKGDPDSATMLVFNADKKKYNSGESAEISFPSSQGAKALVSVENGTGILQQFWLDTQNGETKFTLPITKDMAPNIYVYISLIQPHANTKNDLPIRMYGIIPINVEDKATRLYPQLKMPDVLTPEQEVSVKVFEKNGKAMTYTIAMVDEGLLDLTNFKTPNAWDDFYARQTLGVKTWDIYDDVLGAYGGSLDQVFGIGGDGAANGAKAKKANRFKPVVTYLGPFELKKGQHKTHKIQLPNYVGSVRTMVIAGDKTKGAYGNTEKATPVRKPLMILASLPRKLTPSEKVTLPITVFAMEKHVKDVSVSLKFKKGLKIIGNKTQKLHFANPDEKMVYFELETADFTGISEVEVIAKGNGEQASYKVEIDIVNPNPISSEFKDIMLEPNSSQTVSFDTFGVLGTNTASLEASTLPNMDFSQRMLYLIQYPHGCVEQTTSSVFPQLFLDDIFDISSEKKATIENNIKQGILRLANFQTVSGGLSYWQGQNKANDWGTSYAGHFMLEAEKKGYALPLTFKTNWIKYQKNTARNWRKTGKFYGDLAQAYRLYTLALANAADLASMNNMREASGISNEAKWRLAAAYALAGQKTVAENIVAGLSYDFGTSKYDSYTYGSSYRNQAMALETLALLGQHLKGKDLAKTMADNLSSPRWMSTQSTAYSLLALAKYANGINGKGIQVTYKVNDSKKQSLSTVKTAVLHDLAIQKGSNTITITNKKDNIVFVRVLYKGKLAVGAEKTTQRGLLVTADYKNSKGNRINISQLQQGTDFLAEMQVANKTNQHVKDIAFTEIFPSGWEIVNTRFTDYGSSLQNKADYTDIKDDSVNFYFDLKPNETKVFRVILNASYLGKYYLPGVQAEAMYDNNYFVRNKGQWIEVVK